MTELDIDIIFAYQFKYGELKRIKDITNKDKKEGERICKATSSNITGIYNPNTKKAYIVLKGYKNVVGFKEEDIIKRFTEDSTHETLHFLIAESIGFHEVRPGEEKVVSMLS